jgi:peptidoglycan LD-endopeptidase LytH
MKLDFSRTINRTSIWLSVAVFLGAMSGIFAVIMWLTFPPLHPFSSSLISAPGAAARVEAAAPPVVKPARRLPDPPQATESPVIIPEPSPSAPVPPEAEPIPEVADRRVEVELSFAIPKLVIPVVGVKPEQLRDTFVDTRSETRAHNAIDIMAPQGTPVVASADGKIVKLFSSEKGGITIYQSTVNERLIFYYAHLDRYAEGLKEGQFVTQGEAIAYVGDTGNAGLGNYHLHFAIWISTDPKRYWEGANINPYPLLRGRLR